MTGGKHDSTVPGQDEFEAGTLLVQVLLVWESDGGWHPTTVLYRVEDGPALAVGPWTEAFLDMDQDTAWTYLAERVREGRGGNGYTYEVVGFSVAQPSDIAPIIYARAGEAVVATYEPMGEVAGTIVEGVQSRPESLIVPFVVLVDNRGDMSLVATTVEAEAVYVTGTDGQPEGGPI